jgi:hypothetical protein
MFDNLLPQCWHASSLNVRYGASQRCNICWKPKEIRIMNTVFWILAFQTLQNDALACACDLFKPKWFPQFSGKPFASQRTAWSGSTPEAKNKNTEAKAISNYDHLVWGFGLHCYLLLGPKTQWQYGRGMQHRRQALSETLTIINNNSKSAQHSSTISTHQTIDQTTYMKSSRVFWWFFEQFWIPLGILWAPKNAPETILDFRVRPRPIFPPWRLRVALSAGILAAGLYIYIYIYCCSMCQ